MSAGSRGPRHAISRLTVLALVDEGELTSDGTAFIPGESDRFVAEALGRLVRKAPVAEFSTAGALLQTLATTRPDVVFNLTQWAFAGRMMDGHICALLELEGVPYTGTGPRGLMLSRDKALSKGLAAAAGFRVPRFFVVEAGRIRVPDDFPLPAVVKPRFGDASEGVSQAALVRTRRALVARIAYLRRNRCTEIICEEFIEGREMIVPMYGDTVVRPREFLVGGSGRGAPRIALTQRCAERTI